MTRVAVLVLLLAAGAAGAQTAGTIVLPATILSDARVRRQLDSGLTATFVVVARARGAANGAARLEIRYDLWDEVYIVRRTEFDRRVEQARVASRDALDKWWRTPLRVMTPPAARTRTDVEVTVLPFSAAEQEDARQWLSKSGGVASPDRGSGGLVDALIGTTVNARPITTFKFAAEVPPR